MMYSKKLTSANGGTGEYENEERQIIQDYYKALDEYRKKKKELYIRILEEDNFRGLVKRVSDGKIGKISVVTCYNGIIECGFYPMKKDGTISQKQSNSNMPLKFIEDIFIPYKEDKND